MIKKAKFTALFLLISACTKLYAQNDSLIINRNIKALQNYASANPVEKVHLHLDRPWYFLGDTIWFKGYVVLGEYHKLSALSRILYAELINDKDSVLNRLTLRVNAGTCHGEFIVPFNYKNGTYRIRAYTNWMRNAGPGYFYDQDIVVGSPLLPAITGTVKPNLPPATGAVQELPEKADVQFFPEGGELVNGLRSKVAFKAVNKNGVSQEIQGVVTDMEGNEVASFNTQHLGMGLFPLTPQKGKQYQAKVTGPDGSIQTINLPEAKDAGFTLAVNNNLSDSLYIKIAANDELFKSGKDSSFYLIAQSGGKYYFAAARKLASQVFTASIPKNRFPSGIVQFTLFSQNGEPLNERLVFMQNPDALNLVLSAQNQTYAPGENVKIDLEARDGQNDIAAGTFSVSVVDETKAPIDEAAENTIFTDLLLKSELTGNIENPNYYFTNVGDQTRADLDLLMLTQGYRRFEWKKILSPAGPEISYKPEKGFTLSGVVKTPAGNPIPKGEVILSSLKDHFVIDTLADDKGNFSFPNVDLPDTAKVVINAKKANGGNNVKISVIQPVYPTVAKRAQLTANISNDYTDRIKEAVAAWNLDSLSHVIQLKEVKVTDTKNHFTRPDYSVILQSSANINGPGNADQVYIPENFVGCAFLYQCLEGKLYGVTFSNGIAYSLRATTRHLQGKVPQMAIYVDGTHAPAEYLTEINPMDVYSIEVLTSAMYTSLYGTDAFGGALIITTKGSAGVATEFDAPKGLALYKFKGYYKARSFYSPKYDTKKNVTMADNRKTIYWSPDIITDAKGKASFEYFNAGNKGTYRVTVEGVDGDGKLGRQVLTYNVE